MTEDRFLTLAVMERVSGQLEAAGFKHVVSRHHIDPKWRQLMRPSQLELEPISWTVSVTDLLLPLPKIKALIEICELNNLTVWWGHTSDRELLYLHLGTSDRVAYACVTPNETT
jgi:hypothetical protein